MGSFINAENIIFSKEELNDIDLMNKNTTPEEQWARIKHTIFKNGVPEHIEELMKRGFYESINESEKYSKLVFFLSVIAQKIK